MTADLARREREDRAIARATRILERRALYDAQREPLDGPTVVADYLRFRLNGLDIEQFWAVWLDAQHRPIQAECVSTGTLTQASIYPREIVRRALHLNAAAVVFAHNHPSGCAQPSAADELLTRTLKDTLALVDVRLLDHLVIGAAVRPVSFACRGLL
jgi:DNA repair protein RadC